MPTKPHSSSKSLIPQKREKGADIGYSSNKALVTNIEKNFITCFCLSPQASWVQLCLRKDEFHIGEEFHVDITCENSKCKYPISHFVTEIVKRSDFTVENPPGSQELDKHFKDEQIVLRDKSKYGCWGNKFKEFTIRVVVPKYEPYSRVVNDVPEFDSEDEHDDQLFDVHKDEEQFLGRSLSTTTKTDLIEINYAIRYYAVFEGGGTTAPTNDIPIKIVQNPAAEKMSNHRYDKKPRGWLPLEAPC